MFTPLLATMAKDNLYTRYN